MQPIFNEVLAICPEMVTGGVEALHQLVYKINALGGDAKLAYYGAKSKIVISDDQMQHTVSPESPLLSAYVDYKPRVLKETRFDPHNLVIFPEPLTEAAFTFRHAPRAVWWLSVDSAFVGRPALQDQGTRDELFADLNLIHFVQSHYARQFLVQNRARQVYPLYDYVNRAFVRDLLEDGALEARPARRWRIAYFPRKGGALASQFAAASSDLELSPIENMSRDEVRQVLEDSAIYIDFGHHPGKDRVPREAAATGAVVFLREHGAARCFEDHPLDRRYLFSPEDIQTGDLLCRVRAVLADLATHQRAQRYYRQRILMEEDEFELQVKTFFFKGC